MADELLNSGRQKFDNFVPKSSFFYIESFLKKGIITPIIFTGDK